jgi:hypothetical protein
MAGNWAEHLALYQISLTIRRNEGLGEQSGDQDLRRNIAGENSS